jgi:hypothetical protein
VTHPDHTCGLTSISVPSPGPRQGFSTAAPGHLPVVFLFRILSMCAMLVLDHWFVRLCCWCVNPLRPDLTCCCVPTSCCFRCWCRPPREACDDSEYRGRGPCSPSSPAACGCGVHLPPCWLCLRVGCLPQQSTEARGCCMWRHTTPHLPCLIGHT